MPGAVRHEIIPAGWYRATKLRQGGALRVAQTGIRRASQAFFGQYDLLFTSAASVPPFRHEHGWTKEINGAPMANCLRWEAIDFGLTLMGNPAVVISCGKRPDGLPLGIQIVGPPYCDARLADIFVTPEALFEADEDPCRPRIDLARLMAAANRSKP